jgi:hypothetical protein
MNYKENIRLLNLVKIELTKQRANGLCSYIYIMQNLEIINKKQYFILFSMIKKYEPKNIYSMRSTISKYYFEPYIKNPRIEYLNHLILLNSPNFFIRLYYKFKFRKLYK